MKKRINFDCGCIAEDKNDESDEKGEHRYYLIVICEKHGKVLGPTNE